MSYKLETQEKNDKLDVSKITTVLQGDGTVDVGTGSRNTPTPFNGNGETTN